MGEKERKEERKGEEGKNAHIRDVAKDSADVTFGTVMSQPKSILFIGGKGIDKSETNRHAASYYTEFIFLSKRYPAFQLC